MTSVNDGGNGRDKKGKFSKGNKFGQGNPKLREVAEYKRRVREAFSPDDVVEVLAELRRLAIKEANWKAAEVFLSYVLGRPSSLDEEELRVVEDRIRELESRATSPGHFAAPDPRYE